MGPNTDSCQTKVIVKQIFPYVFQDSVVELLEHKHLSEQDYFVQLLRTDPDQAMVQEAAMLSQQQRKDRLHEIKNRKLELPPGNVNIQQQRKDRLHEIKNRKLEVPPGNINIQLYKSSVFLIVLLDILSFANLYNTIQ